LRAEGFFCNLDVLYGGLWIGKLKFLIPTKFIFFQFYFFFNICSLKPWIRIGIQPKMLDLDPDEMNADPQPNMVPQRKGKINLFEDGDVLFG
jgi:hypothetical protein